MPRVHKLERAKHICNGVPPRRGTVSELPSFTVCFSGRLGLFWGDRSGVSLSCCS